MKVIILTMGIIFLAYGSTTGQEEGRKLDIVHMHSGKKLKGKILEHRKGSEVDFVDIHGTEMLIPEYQISKITQKKLKALRQKGVVSMAESGFYHTYALALLANTVSSASGGLRGVELSFSAGHRLNPYQLLGAGIGIDFYHTRAGEMMVPLFVEARRNLTAKAITPYVSIRAGYSIGIANPDQDISEASGGPMLNPSIGWRLGASSGMNMLLQVGLKFQKASFLYETSSATSEIDLTYKRLQVGIAMQF
ncbi:MAG: hypothetical protein KTR24_12450 [Saprospiraceae bacterium]|nr:hypothetical protein [Saprospiraceae bacterium]